MLDALMGGRWLTAGELAAAAGVARPTASEHLARLVEGELVASKRQGRHRYFGLAGAGVAELLEAVAVMSSPPQPRSLRSSIQLDQLRAGRRCYDHLAGRLGVELTEALVAVSWLAEADAAWTVTDRGEAGFERLGIDVNELRARPPPLVRSCIDWTERRPHLAGALGAALAARLEESGWTTPRSRETRAMQMTPLGRQRLGTLFGVEVA